MKLLRQFGIVVAIFVFGELINRLINIPIPGNIIGMIVLFMLLQFKVIKVESLKEISDFLLNHLAFFFIPPGVALVASLDKLSDVWISFIVITIITTTLVMSVTGITVQKILRRGKSDE